MMFGVAVGRVACATKSLAGSPDDMLVHVAPPSVVRNTPPSLTCATASPGVVVLGVTADTGNVEKLVVMPVFSRDQVAPPSVVFHTPPVRPLPLSESAASQRASPR